LIYIIFHPENNTKPKLWITWFLSLVFYCICCINKSREIHRSGSPDKEEEMKFVIVKGPWLPGRTHPDVARLERLFGRVGCEQKTVNHDSPEAMELFVYSKTQEFPVVIVLDDDEVVLEVRINPSDMALRDKIRKAGL